MKTKWLDVDCWQFTVNCIAILRGKSFGYLSLLWSDDAIECNVILPFFAPSEQKVGSKGVLEKTEYRSVGAKPFFIR